MREPGLADLKAVIAVLRRSVVTPARLYLVSRTSHLVEGWRVVTPALELADDGRVSGVADAVRATCLERGVDLIWESPADIIPMPVGWEERSRPVSGQPAGPLQVHHFDPYSAVLRLIARGDEPDYVTALAYIRHGWVEPARLEGLLNEVVPRMTMKTLAQDPAEFRRKFKGLRQIYTRDHGAYSPGGTRVAEAVASA